MVDEEPVVGYNPLTALNSRGFHRKCATPVRMSQKHANVWGNATAAKLAPNTYWMAVNGGRR